MSDKCVVCNGVGEGKPLYKKLGSSDCSTDIFTALHEMQLISLPLQEKDNHYICWDCDESVAEEYLTFIKTETKRKADEDKRKKQDEARNIKLQKKLKLAFKKVHEENLRASGIIPPVSKYKMKEKEREENKYHSSHCILCKCSFEDNQGRSYQRFSLMKMVNDEHDVAQVLQKLDVHLNIDLSDEIKRKRFVCCLCYNKMRRDYKSKNKNELEKESKNIMQNSFINKINNETQDIFKRRPTAEEHAAEIAKLIPPSLANLYKVVTQDEKDSKKMIKEGHCDDGNNKATKIRKHKQSGSSSEISNSSDDSSSDSSSSTSSSDSSDSENDRPLKSLANNNNSSYYIKNLPTVSTAKKYKSGKKDSNVIATKHNNFNRDFTGISSSRHLKGTDSLGHSEGDAAMDIIKNGICNLCGLTYSFRPKSFWNSLDSPMPSVTGVTVVDALKILDSKLASVSANVRKKKYVCKPCYAKVCNGFRSQIIQRIAEKKGIAVDQLEASKLKVKGMDSSLSNPPVRKINGTCDNKFENRSLVMDAAKKGFPESHHKKKSKNQNKHHHAKKHKEHVKSKVHERTTDRDVKLNSRSDHRKAVFKFTKSRSDHINSPKFIHDMALLKLINKSRHLQYKGKVVVLYNVCVNVVEIKDVLPSSAFKNEPVRLELLRNVHLYSNLYRNLKNRTGWSTCILCHKTKLLLKETTHWLEDPVAPPNLMVPLRWAQLSLVNPSSTPTKPNLATEDGKVCPSCHQNLAEQFGKFVGAKVAVSHGLSSEKIVLDKYKVSFDSNAMNIVADPLERVVAVKENAKKHRIGPKSKRQEIEYYIVKPDKTPNCSSIISDESVIPASESGITNVENHKLEDIPNHEDDFLENQDNVSLDLALSESSDSENDAIISDRVVSKLNHKSESTLEKTPSEILESDKPTENVSILSSISMQNDLTEATKDEKSFDANVEAYNSNNDDTITSKIDINNMNTNIAVGGNGEEVAVEETVVKANVLLHSPEIASNALTPVNEVQTGETILRKEISADKFLHNGLSRDALPLENLNKPLNSHTNNSEGTNKQEQKPLVKDTAEDCQNFASFETNPDSIKLHENKDINCNENNDAEVSEHTTKQINLSKIIPSLSTSHATQVKNQEKDQPINNTENTKRDLCGNVEVTVDNNNRDFCKLNTMKGREEITNQNEFKKGISPKSSNAFESNCNSNDHIESEMVSDALISNNNNKSANINISESEITSSLDTNNDCSTHEKTSAILENDINMATSLNTAVLEISNVAAITTESSTANNIVDVRDTVTSSCSDSENDNSNKLLLTANAQLEINHEDPRLPELVSETSFSGIVTNKTDENDKYHIKKLEICGAESVEKCTKQIDKEDNINEHCGSEAFTDIENSTKGQMKAATWLVEEKEICSEIGTDSRTSAENYLRKDMSKGTNGPVAHQPEFKSNCDLDVERATTDKDNTESKRPDKDNTERTTTDNDNSEMTTPDKDNTERTTTGNITVQVEPIEPIQEEKNQQETQADNDNHKSIKNDNIKHNSLSSSQTKHELKILEAVIGTTDIKTIKIISEMRSDHFKKTFESNADAVSCVSTVDETINNSSLTKEDNVLAIKHCRIMGNDVRNMVKDDDFILSRHLQNEVLQHSNVDHKEDDRMLNSSKESNEDILLGPKKSSNEVWPDSENLRKSTNNGESKRKYENDHTDSEMLPKAKKLMTNSSQVGKELSITNNDLTKSNDVSGDKLCTKDSKVKNSIIPYVIKESEVHNNENIPSIVKNTRTSKPTKRSRALSRSRRRSTVSNSKTQNKCLSELIDKEKATSVDVITDYLNSQCEKIKELIKPISSEEIHHNAKTCVETVSENLMKIRSKLDRDLNKSINCDLELPLAGTSEKGVQKESTQDQIHTQDLGFLAFESDPLVEDIGENTVAPFAQRKKCRGRPPNTGSDHDFYDSTPNTENVSSAEEVRESCVLNIWQSIQGVSLDDLLTKDIHQPLRVQQYNVGFVLTLNDLRNLIGASLDDLVSWLQKLIPLELSEKGLKPCTEKISSFIFSLNKSSLALDAKKLNEQLSEDLFVHDKSICNLHKEEVNENMCFVEDIMDESVTVKDKEIRWDDYLAPVNLDNLLKGKESRVTWEQFNNGLLYALWKVNNLLHGDEENFVKWLSLTSTTPMKASDYYAMAKAVIAIDKHLVTYPEEINKLVAPIVVKSDKEASIKKIPSRNKSVPNVPSADDDDVILEKITVKSSSQNNTLIDNQEKKKRPLCDRLNEALNNNSRKHTISPSNTLQPPSKKTARVLPQPSQESETPSVKHTGKGYLQGGLKGRKIEEKIKKYVTIASKQKECNSSYVPRLKNNRSASLNSISSSSKQSTKIKNIISNKPSAINGDSNITASQSSSEDRLPVITKVTSISNTESLSITEHQDDAAEVNIENENINVYKQPPLMSNESLQAQIQYALINQVKISTGDSTNSILPRVNSVGSPNVPNYNASGVPMIPVMSPSGYVTMIPLSIRIPNLPSSPIMGNSLPYNLKSPNMASNLPYTIQNFPALKESPKEKELECKVSDLEKQLQEIQKQNSQLFELNKKLLKKTTNTEEPQVLKGLSKTRESSHYKNALVPSSLQANEDSLHKLPPTLRRRGRPRKDVW